jgi:hypothetical protein
MPREDDDPSLIAIIEEVHDQIDVAKSYLEQHAANNRAVNRSNSSGSQQGDLDQNKEQEERHQNGGPGHTPPLHSTTARRQEQPRFSWGNDDNELFTGRLHVNTGQNCRQQASTDQNDQRAVTGKPQATAGQHNQQQSGGQQQAPGVNNQQQQTFAGQRRPFDPNQYFRNSNNNQLHSVRFQPTAFRQQPNNTPPNMPATPLLTTFRPFKLDPPKFAGDPKEWATFWMAFDRAVHSQHIPDYEKHICLLQSLVKDSPAHRAVSAYQPSDENYGIVLNILDTRFGDPKALREGLVAELLHLPMAHNSLSSLRTLHEHIERICLQLQTANANNPSQDEIVCGIIRSKMPREVLEALFSQEQSTIREWTLNDLRAGFGRIVALKERLERSMNIMHPREAIHRDNTRQTPPATHYKPDWKQQQKAFEERAFAGINQQAPTSERQSPMNTQGCSLCDEGQRHRPSECPIYRSPQQRRNRIREQGRCFNCLRNNHNSYDCNEQKRCSNCGGKHNFLICCEARNPRQQGQQPWHQQDDQQQESHQVQPVQRQLPAQSEQYEPEHQQPYRQQTGANAHPLGQTRQPLSTTSGNFTGIGIEPLPSTTSDDLAMPTQFQSVLTNPAVCQEETTRELLQAVQTTLSKLQEAIDSRPTPPVASDNMENDPLQLAHSATTAALQPMEDKPRAFLMTRSVYVSAPEGNPKKAIPAMLLFDPGSQTSYISASLVKRLGLRQGPIEHMSVNVLGGTKTAPFSTSNHTVLMKRQDNHWERIQLNYIDEITTALETHHWLGSGDQPETEKPEEAILSKRAVPDILIGIRQFWNYFVACHPLQAGFYVIQTTIGPVLGGESRLIARPDASVSLMSLKPVNQKPTSEPPSSAETVPPTTMPPEDMPRLLLNQATVEAAPNNAPKFNTCSASRRSRKGSKLPAELQSKTHGKPTGTTFRQLVTTALFIALFGLFLIQTPIYSSAHQLGNCSQCTVNCAQTGVIINAPAEIQEVDICCMGTCWSGPTTAHFTFELPQEMLVNDHECLGRFWHDSSQEFTAIANCPARDECELLDCTFCWEMVTNPTCQPTTAMALIGIGAALLLTWLIYKLVAMLFYWPFVFWLFMNQPQRPPSMHFATACFFLSIPTTAAQLHLTEALQAETLQTWHDFANDMAKAAIDVILQFALHALALLLLLLLLGIGLCIGLKLIKGCQQRQPDLNQLELQEVRHQDEEEANFPPLHFTCSRILHPAINGGLATLAGRGECRQTRPTPLATSSQKGEQAGRE